MESGYTLLSDFYTQFMAKQSEQVLQKSNVLRFKLDIAIFHF